MASLFAGAEHESLCFLHDEVSGATEAVSSRLGAAAQHLANGAIAAARTALAARLLRDYFAPTAAQTTPDAPTVASAQDNVVALSRDWHATAESQNEAGPTEYNSAVATKATVLA